MYKSISLSISLFIYLPPVVSINSIFSCLVTVDIKLHKTQALNHASKNPIFFSGSYPKIFLQNSSSSKKKFPILRSDGTL